jgi:RNA polymerase sigma-70 factor, ECF subfamily
MGDPLLRLVRGGNSSVHDDLYAELAPLVNKLLWTFLGPDPERDDLAHEIFLRILRNANGLRDASRLQAWATRVTLNAIKNEFRSRKIRRLLSFGSQPDELEIDHSDFEGREVLLHTYRVLSHLPTDERIPFTMHFIGLSSLEETAAACGCSLRTINRRLKSARARFVRLAVRNPILAERVQRSVEGEGDHD